jgi:hypothetical protein
MKALITGGPQPPGTAAVPPDANGSLWLDPDGFVEHFGSDVDRVEAQVICVTQRPIAASELLSDEPFGVPAWKALTSWYLVTEQHFSCCPQSHSITLLSGSVTSIDSGHIAMVSRPDAVAAFTRGAASALVADGAAELSGARRDGQA